MNFANFKARQELINRFTLGKSNNLGQNTKFSTSEIKMIWGIHKSLHQNHFNECFYCLLGNCGTLVHCMVWEKLSTHEEYCPLSFYRRWPSTRQAVVV